MGKIIAVYSMKGGVGKSSLSVNLAHSAATGGAKTLLWDIDAQGAASFLLGQDGFEQSGPKAKRIFSKDVDAAAMIEPTHYAGLELIAADLSLRHIDRTLAEGDKPKRLRKLLQALAPSYDRIILDCPPGLGELSDQIFRAADLIVVPLVPAPLALRTLEQVREHLVAEHGKKPPTLLPVFSMVDKRKSLHRDLCAAQADWLQLPQASVVERMAVEQAPLAVFAGKTAAAKAVAGVWRAVEAALA